MRNTLSPGADQGSVTLSFLIQEEVDGKLRSTHLSTNEFRSIVRSLAKANVSLLFRTRRQNPASAAMCRN